MKLGDYINTLLFHASPDGEWGMVGSVVVGDINYEDYTNFSKMDVVPSFSGSVRNVPDDYETIQDAMHQILGT